MIARSFSKPLARPLLKPFVSQLFSRRCIWGSGSRILQTIDLHAAGEPARVVTSGVPHVPGITMAEKRVSCQCNLETSSMNWCPGGLVALVLLFACMTDLFILVFWQTYLMEHMDGLRKLLLQEPRGYPCQNANLVLPSSIPG
jgi:proline racemase